MKERTRSRHGPFLTKNLYYPLRIPDLKKNNTHFRNSTDIAMASFDFFPYTATWVIVDIATTSWKRNLNWTGFGWLANSHLSMKGFPGGTSGKKPACQCRRRGTCGQGRSPGGRHGNPLQYSCPWENPMDRGAWWDMVHGVSRSQKRLKRLSTSLYKK